MPDYNPENASALVELVRSNIQAPIDDLARSKKRSNLLKSINQKAGEDQLGEMIQLLAELRDFDNGVNWIEINRPNGLNVLVRDAKFNISALKLIS